MIAAPHLEKNQRYRVHRDFHSAFLPDDRDITVYLPPRYFSEPSRRFPVFYLHDGQNLFDPEISYVRGHTWRADLTVDDLVKGGVIDPVILVGIANAGARRMAEYTLTPDLEHGGGEGRSYARLLIEDLKPWIDRSYRTLPDRENTALGGSSLGGLISLEIAMEHPEVFGMVAAMSPSLWWDGRSIFTRVEAAAWLPRPRIWLDIGELEGLWHVHDTIRMERLLRRKGWDASLLSFRRYPGGTHSEDAWAERFGEVLRFFFGRESRR